jgi:hypothetical protein
VQIADIDARGKIGLSVVTEDNPAPQPQPGTSGVVTAAG